MKGQRGHITSVERTSHNKSIDVIDQLIHQSSIIATIITF